MKFVLFYHSFTSCWNHDNAHFLRGVARVLARRGHAVVVYEPDDGWSRRNALQHGGAAVLEECATLVPGVTIRPYRLQTLDLDRALDGADVVIAHDWNDRQLIRRLGKHRRAGGRFQLLFHDTHHGASGMRERQRTALESFDAVLAHGEALRQAHVGHGWGRRAATWRTAADTALFRPQREATKDADLIWIGSWDDGERERELERLLVRPIALLGLRAQLHGVGDPARWRARLRHQRVTCEGWLPNHRAPAAFARARAAISIPRPSDRSALACVPATRMFEALACGVPLVSAPWDDTERLFHAGSYLTAADSDDMAAALMLILHDRDLAAEMASIGLCSVQARHTCEHRVDELFAVLDRLDVPGSGSFMESRGGKAAIRLNRAFTPPRAEPSLRRRAQVLH